MMNLDHNVIRSIINDLDKSIEFHNHAIADEDCFKNDIGESNCHHCNLSSLIDDLDCLKSHLKPLDKNTINSIQFIDVESFCYTLAKQSNIDSISIEPTYDTLGQVIGFSVFANYSRYTMNGAGYHVGYENVTYKWIAIDKRQLEISGIPYLLSSWVVNPDSFGIESKDLPENDNPEHDPECEFKDDPNSFDDCDCAEFFEGYFQPEDDFFYSEMNHILEQCDWIEAEFDSDIREWTLGYTSFNVSEYQSNQDYADSCNQDDGRPSLGNY